jgi:hypothetical protein
MSFMHFMVNALVTHTTFQAQFPSNCSSF